MSEISKLLLINRGENTLRMALEPWAWQYKIEPGKTIEIVAGEQTETSIDVVYEENGFLSIYGWSDDMKVMIDGEEMEMDFS